MAYEGKHFPLLKAITAVAFVTDSIFFLVLARQNEIMIPREHFDEVEVRL